ncbi:MAG: ABC transporter ATP-binding protein, partial [Clostridiales bacterium]|nr:ABC transporter ATP-binding protein [Clostridiales bacterium]
IFVTHDQDEAMSISDQIVVMRDGVVQQTGRPQEVYDSPANLFVAKFLGTPPINVFEGHLRDGWLYIGEDRVLKASGVAAVGGNGGLKAFSNGSAVHEETGQAVLSDRDVWVGIRPEGFLLREEGPLVCDLNGVEVMGRDISVLSRNRASVNPTVRSIISTENRVDTASPKVRFALRPEKVFLFDKKTEERL